MGIVESIVHRGREPFCDVRGFDGGIGAAGERFAQRVGEVGRIVRRLPASMDPAEPTELGGMRGREVDRRGVDRSVHRSGGVEPGQGIGKSGGVRKELLDGERLAGLESISRAHGPIPF